MISQGDRIAQVVLGLAPQVRWHDVDGRDKLASSNRNGGFGFPFDHFLYAYHYTG